MFAISIDVGPCARPEWPSRRAANSCTPRSARGDPETAPVEPFACLPVMDATVSWSRWSTSLTGEAQSQPRARPGAPVSSTTPNCDPRHVSVALRVTASSRWKRWPPPSSSASGARRAPPCCRSTLASSPTWLVRAPMSRAAVRQRCSGRLWSRVSSRRWSPSASSCRSSRGRSRDVLRWSTPVATAVLIVLGVVLLAGRNPFDRLVGVRMPVVRNSLA